jgi:ParB-like chromosome segregation protein Spo0J
MEQMESALAHVCQEIRDIVVEVEIDSLSAEGSPRISGENPEHVQALAEAQAQLPPIIVHSSTMRVIDGAHRLRAAQLRGDQKIPVRFFDGDEADAFVLAVESNIAHGLPLTMADRKRAAARIIGSHPHWSDRAIASVAGIAPGTVAELRRRAPAGSRPVSRLGQDGRIRPVDGTEGRRRAGEIIRENPGLSLRQIARAAGISPETARDVRRRLTGADDEVARRRPGRGDGEAVGGRSARADGEIARPRSARADDDDVRRRPGRADDDVAAAIERLLTDPALRFSEGGRALLRLLHLHFVETREWTKIGENVPLHCSGTIVHLARDCSTWWKELAERVQENVANVS